MITSSPAAGTHYSQDEGGHKAHIQKELTLIYSGKKCHCGGFNRGELHSGDVSGGGSELEQKVIHRRFEDFIPGQDVCLFYSSVEKSISQQLRNMAD